MRSVSYLIATAAFLLNPLVACESDAHFDYGPREIRAALAGTWTATVTADDGATHTVKFEVDFGTARRRSSAGLVKSASACSHRSFVSSADACADITDVSLKLIAIEGETPTDARFIVGSTRFEHGDLRLHIDGAYVHATISRQGVVEDASGAQIVHAL